MKKRKPKFSVMLDTSKMRQLREAKGLTMAEAAEAAGLGTRQRWHQIENWKPGAAKSDFTNVKLSTLNAIAHVLGVHATELLK